MKTVKYISSDGQNIISFTLRVLNNPERCGHGYCSHCSQWEHSDNIPDELWPLDSDDDEGGPYYHTEKYNYVFGEDKQKIVDNLLNAKYIKIKQ